MKCTGLNGLGFRENEYFTLFSCQCYMLADVILEWSDGGIFLPLLFSERRDGVEQKSILGGEGKMEFPPKI